jgi:hypothetical protein
LPVSTATVVGRIELPPGKAWSDVIASPSARAAVLCDFQAMAARAMGLPLHRVQVHNNVDIPGSGTKGMYASDWHQDSCGRHRHVLCVLGVEATQFLLGEISDAFFAEPRDTARLEREMRLWQPRPGELVRLDRHTIHRRPPVVAGSRMFLVATPAASAPR